MTIRIYLLLAAVTILMVACGQSEEVGDTSVVPAEETVATVVDSTIQWQPFESIQRTFPRAPKPIFLYLYQDGCDHCTHMDTTVFDRTEIARYLNANFVPIKVDPYVDPPFKVQDSLMSDLEFRQMLAIRETPAYYFFARNGRVAGVFHSEMELMFFKRMLVYIQDGHFGRTPIGEYMKLPEASDDAINARFE